MDKLALARSLSLFAALGLGWFGAIYLLRSFLGSAFAAAWHARLAEQPFESLPPALANLYRSLAGALGALFLSSALLGALLALRLGSGPEGALAFWGLLLLHGVAQLALSAVNLRNGARSPWWMNLSLLSLVLLSLALAGLPQGA